MKNDLIKIYQIESDTKLEKLKEERTEFNREFRKYQDNPSTENMDLMINELIDVVVVVLQLAIVKHGYSMREIVARLRNKVKLVVSIKELMKSDSIGYNEARGRLR